MCVICYYAIYVLYYYATYVLYIQLAGVLDERCICVYSATTLYMYSTTTLYMCSTYSLLECWMSAVYICTLRMYSAVVERAGIYVSSDTTMLTYADGRAGVEPEEDTHIYYMYTSMRVVCGHIYIVV